MSAAAALMAELKKITLWSGTCQRRKVIDGFGPIRELQQSLSDKCILCVTHTERFFLGEFGTGLPLKQLLRSTVRCYWPDPGLQVPVAVQHTDTLLSHLGVRL